MQIYLMCFSLLTTVDIGSARAAKATPECGGSEKRIEREIDKLLLQAPLYLKAIYGSVT